MKITLNGQPYALEDKITISQLIDRLGLTEKRYAVEVNESIVPRSQHSQSHLHAGDKVEIIQAIGGG